MFEAIGNSPKGLAPNVLKDTATHIASQQGTENKGLERFFSSECVSPNK